jgi:type IV pilus assembly protein PilW
MEPIVRQQGFRSARRERGLTMVELMIGMVIALIGTIVIFQVFAVSEQYKRTTTGGSDAIQNSNFSLYQLERQFAWAGSGLARMPNMWGCAVQLRRAGAAVFPSPSPFPAPFDVLPQTVRMTPFLIRDGGGATPDVVFGISGSNDSVNTPVAVSGAPTAANVGLLNTVGVKTNDFLMIVEQESVGASCPVAQVANGAAPATPTVVGPNPVPFNVGDTATNGFQGFSASSKVANLGPTPQFMAFAIGTDPATGVGNVLLTYDLRNGAQAPFNGQPLAIADNVVNLQAIYGVAAVASDPKVAQWVPPTAPWDAATLMDGSAASADRIARLRAIRIAVVARNAQWERDQVSPATVTLFADLATSNPDPSVTVNLSATDRQYRYKVVDTVISLRNMLIAAN